MSACVCMCVDVERERRGREEVRKGAWEKINRGRKREKWRETENNNLNHV